MESCKGSTECSFVYFHLTQLSLESVSRMIAYMPSVQGLKVSVCHVCTRAFLHVFYVWFMFVFFHVCTFAHTVRVRLFCVSVFNVRVRVSCSLFKVMMLAGEKSHSETRSAVATLSCTPVQLGQRLKSSRV